jgi:hypothetical protein
MDAQVKQVGSAKSWVSNKKWVQTCGCTVDAKMSSWLQEVGAHVWVYSGCKHVKLVTKSGRISMGAQWMQKC